MISNKEPKKRTSERTPDEDKFLKNIGKKISQLASQKNISLERLAYQGDVSKGYLYDVVKGKSNPSILVLYRIAASLEININKFFS